MYPVLPYVVILGLKNTVACKTVVLVSYLSEGHTYAGNISDRAGFTT